MEHEIDYIRSRPTLVCNTHESTLQAYQILNKVEAMLKRGDSRETILEMIDYLKAKNGDKK